MDMEKICFETDIETAHKFNAALMLNKEELNTALDKCIKLYIKEAFLNAADVSDNISGVIENTANADDNKTKGTENKANEKESNFAKARQRIPKWAQYSTQNNHKIIKAYFTILDDRGFVTFKDLLKMCSDKYNYPEMYVADFRGNFAQMKTDAGNSYGKVFNVTYDIVEIWDEVADVLLEYKRYFV